MDETILAAGTQAPDLPVTIDEATAVQLATLWAQRPLVLAFFGELTNPFTQDNAAQLRDGHDAITRAGAGLAVVTRLPIAMANAFEQQWAIPYPLLADEDGAIGRAFGAAGSATFVIGTDGAITFSRAAANLADYPPVVMLLNAICDITGAERPKTEDSEPIEFTAMPQVNPNDPTLSPRVRGFECIKCGGTVAEHRDISTTGGALSRVFDYQGHKFIASSCAVCGYTELYRRKAGMLGNALDLLAAG